MFTLRQSSQIQCPANEMLRLLESAPLFLTVDQGPLVFYTAPEGWQLGSPVRFTLVQGIWRQSWEAVVARNEQGCIHTLYSGKDFASWSTLVEIVEIDNSSCVVRDLWEWEGAVPELDKILSCAAVAHALANRRATESLVNSAPTTRFQAIEGSSQASA